MLHKGERHGETGQAVIQRREREGETQRAGQRGGACTEGQHRLRMQQGRKTKRLPLNPCRGILIKLLILPELQLQRTVNYTWKIVWAGPLADGKTVVANEISRLPCGTAPVSFLLGAFRVCMGYRRWDLHWGVFFIMNKTTIKKRP